MSLEEIAQKLNAEEGSNDSRHQQMDSCICWEGIHLLETPLRPPVRSVNAACLRVSASKVAECRFAPHPALVIVGADG